MSYDHNPCVFYEVAMRLEPMFNPNGWQSEKVYHYDNGRQWLSWPRSRIGRHI